jgi:glycyl-tRNA synthetase beta chain
MHGDRVLEGHLLGQESGNSTRGHRIHSPGPHHIPSSRDYSEILLQSFVMADHNQRKEHIRRIVEQAAPDVLINSDLLNEVNNLVEWPIAVECAFEEEFLEVPHAALIASMQDHQKFFPVRNSSDPKLVTNRFVGVANIDSTDISAVQEGYERVIRPRLADARFFLEQDQKQSLASYLPRLESVVFQKNIGTIGDKSQRISNLSTNISDLISEDSVVAGRAASLAKCDLVTQMVGEFPELQGVMGQQYALSSGESPEVAAAIAEHYAPRFAGDEIPPSRAGRIVSIADRLDTLVGIFAAGLRPTGNKDPFALRRSALGLVRILIEAELDLSLEALLKLAANELSSWIEVTPDLLAEVSDFVVERLRHYYREQGYAAELINAVIATNFDTLPDLDRRLKAIAQFMGQEEAQSLAAANKRIGNILRKAGESGFADIDEDRVVLGQERRLFDEVNRLGQQVAPLLKDGDYLSGLLLLASLKTPVDDFFDSVMVMDEDPVLRANRLALLHRLKSLFDQIADLSVLG